VDEAIDSISFVLSLVLSMMRGGMPVFFVCTEKLYGFRRADDVGCIKLFQMQFSQ